MKKLFILPNTLHPDSSWSFIPPAIDALIAESHKGAHAYLKRFSLGPLPIYLLNEHSKDLQDLLEIPQEKVGLISDAGMPCLADPGALLIFKAREKNISVITFPGPSSIMMALVLSGCPAQAFCFHGYLERDSSKLTKQLERLPQGLTHIFIEAPYRNQRLLEHLLKVLAPQDTLCLASDLTGPEERVVSQTIKKWTEKPCGDFDKKPTVFVLYKKDFKAHLPKNSKPYKSPFSYQKGEKFSLKTKTQRH